MRIRPARAGPERTYDYKDEQGNPPTSPPPAWRQQDLSSSAGRTARAAGSEDGGRHPLPYRLPELLAARPRSAPWPRGRRRRTSTTFCRGLSATTNHGGAVRRPDHARTAGRRVVILPTTTPRPQARGPVGASLQKICSEVRVLALPGLPPRATSAIWPQADAGDPCSPRRGAAMEPLPGAPDGPRRRQRPLSWP